METKLIKFGLIRVKRGVSWSERQLEIDVNAIRYFTSKGELRFEMALDYLSIEIEQSNPNIINLIHSETKKLQVKLCSDNIDIINKIYNTFLSYKNKTNITTTNIESPSPPLSLPVQPLSHIDNIIHNIDLILSQCKNWIYLHNINSILFEISNIDNNTIENNNNTNKLQQLISSLILSNNTNSNLNFISHTLQMLSPLIFTKNKSILTFIYFFILTFFMFNLSNTFYTTLVIILFSFIYFTLKPFYNRIYAMLLTFINQIAVCVKRETSTKWDNDFLDLKELCFMRISSLVQNKTLDELTEMLIINGGKKEEVQQKVIKNKNEEMNLLYWFQGSDVLMKVDVIKKRKVLHLGTKFIMVETYIPLNGENKQEVMKLILDSFKMINTASYLKG
jgi:hypothetical protein